MNDAPLSAPLPILGSLTFGQTLDRVFHLLRSRFGLLVGVAAWPVLAVLGLTAAGFGVFLALFGFHPLAPIPPVAQIVYIVSAALLLSIVSLLVYALYLPAASFASVQADREATVTVRQSYQVACRNYARSLWLMILIGLYIAIPVAVFALLIGGALALIRFAAIAGPGHTAAFLLIPLIALLYIAIFVYSVFITVRFSAAYPACVTEQLTARASLRRSAFLTRGNRWRILGVFAICYAAAYALNLVVIALYAVVVVLGAVVAATVAHIGQNSPAFLVLLTLAGLAYVIVICACMIFSYAVCTVALGVLYNDLLRRKTPLPPPPPTVPVPSSHPA